MARSLKKGPFVDERLIRKLESNTKIEVKQPIISWSRRSTIVPIIIGTTISIHNGRENYPVFISDQIIGHKLGEFAITRTFKGHRKTNKKLKR